MVTNQNSTVINVKAPVHTIINNNMNTLVYGAVSTESASPDNTTK